MYIELHSHSEYSFLRGGSSLERLVRTAAEMGMSALALTDRDNLSGVVKFTALCDQYGIQPIYGVEFTLSDETPSPLAGRAGEGWPLVLLAETPDGYANLCALLSIAFAEGGRKTPKLAPEHLPCHSQGVICLAGCRTSSLYRAVAGYQYGRARQHVEHLIDCFGRDNVCIELNLDRTPGSERVCRGLAELAETLGLKTIASSNVHYAAADDFITHDALRCIALGLSFDDLHPERPFNAEQRLHTLCEMRERFAWLPQALDNTLAVAERCGRVLPWGLNLTPQFIGDAPATLRQLAYDGGLKGRPALTVTQRRRVDEELAEIENRGYCDYFLMVYDLIAWAWDQGLHCPLRGSALDCYLCFRLGFTDVDALARDLPFVRFMSEHKVPDIDIDFGSSRWYEVFRYMVAKYGAQHVAVCCTHFTYQGRGAVRDLGKVLGLPKESLDLLSKRLSHMTSAETLSTAFDRFAELRPFAGMKDRFDLLFRLCAKIADFPRHLSSHSSGLVVSRVPLTSIAPVIPSAREVVPIWSLDKDDCEDMGAVKLDLLALRMLSAAADAEADIRRDVPEFRFDAIPENDKDTFEMFRAGRAVGTFQFESSAQLSLAGRLLPDRQSHLDAAVALIRPGPVRGHAVDDYVAAVRGWRKPDYAHPCLVPILEKTFGLVIFQEQLIGVLAALTGCTDTEADKIRKSLKKHSKQGTMEQVKENFLAQARERHPDIQTPKLLRVWEQIEGWSGYGFTEGHSAAFALTGYRTAYLSVHHAASFYAALVNNIPMGFYNANSYMAEARRRGVQILGVDVNESGDVARADGEYAIRLGFRQVQRLTADDIGAILAAREARPFASLLDFCCRVLMRRDRLETLLLSGAFDRLHEDLKPLLFGLDETLGLARSFRADALPAQERFGFELPEQMETPTGNVPDFSPFEKFCASWSATGISAECHVFAYYRDLLAAKGFVSAYEANRARNGTLVRVAGITIRPHRPPTKSGMPVLFASVEDETDLTQLICLGDAIDRCTATFLLSAAVMVEGVVERRQGAMTVNVQRAKPFDPERLGRRTAGIAERDNSIKPMRHYSHQS